jgi:hypothetical protein
MNGYIVRFDGILGIDHRHRSAIIVKDEASEAEQPCLVLKRRACKACVWHPRSWTSESMHL